MTALVINLDPKEGAVDENLSIPFYAEVRKGLDTLQLMPNVYRTRVVHPTDRGCNWEYQFRTVSKELHLTFGKTGNEFLFSLGRMLEHILQGDVDEVIINRADGHTTHITRIQSPKQGVIVLNFSSAR